MASIAKRETKKGITYRIYVDVTDPETNIRLRKTKTWTPTPGLTEEKIKELVQKEANKFEMEVKENANYGLNPTNYTVSSFSKVYLDYVKRTDAVSTYMRLLETFEYINDKIGNVKLSKLTPAFIQQYFDNVDKEKRIEETIMPKPEFNDVLKLYGLNYRNLRHEYGIQHFTLKKAMDGLKVEKVWADTLVSKTGIPFNELFNIVKVEIPYALNTLKKKKAALRQMLAYAKRTRVVKENYATADFVTYSKEGTKKDIEAMSEEQAKKFYETLLDYPGIREKTSLLVFLLTGFRRGEVTGLKWEDIDFIHDKITVNRSINQVAHYGIVIKDPKTKRSNRTISMPKILKDHLLEYKQWQDEEIKKHGDFYKDEGWVFTKDNGEFLSPTTFLFWLHKVLDKAELPEFTIHSLRHTNITLQIAGGIPLITVSGRAGHSRTSTTTDIYAHFISEPDTRASEYLDDFFEEPKEAKLKQSDLAELVQLKEKLNKLGIKNFKELDELL